MEVVGAIVAALFLRQVLKKEYSWLNTDVALGRKYTKEYPEVLKKTKQVFFMR